MFARALTFCSLALLADAALAVARAMRADWAEFDWAACLFAGVFQIPMLLQLAVLATCAFMDRRVWLAALVVLPAAVWVSVVAATLEAERPTGPEAYETLVIGRVLAFWVTGPVSLVAMLVVQWLVPAPGEARASPLARRASERLALREAPSLARRANSRANSRADSRANGPLRFPFRVRLHRPLQSQHV
jgi:hypothetical protein